MKKIIALIVCILLTILVNAQDTSVVCIPTSVARQIVKDLVEGDSAKAVLASVQNELDAANEKIDVQMSDIDNYKRINNLLGQQLNNEVQQKNNYITTYEICQSQYKDLSKKYKLAKFKSSLKSAIGLPVVLLLGVLYILK